MFVWEGVLTDYTSGMACVYARDEKEAWEIVKREDQSVYNELHGTEPYCVDSTDETKFFFVYGGG